MLRRMYQQMDNGKYKPETWQPWIIVPVEIGYYVYDVILIWSCVKYSKQDLGS